MDFSPHALSQQFSRDQLPRQLIICKQLSLLPQTWKKESLGEYWIGVHPDLPYMPMRSTKSSLKVCFLGYVIDPVKGTYNQPVPPETDKITNSFQQLESYLNSLSGRFICVVTDGRSSRLYLDASGSLSMMYSPKHQIAASSLMLIPYGKDIDDDLKLVEKLSVHEKNGIYPFGLTSRKKVKRLLPNHYLDLNNWQVTRHWPLASFNIIDDTEWLASKIGETMQNTINAVLDQGFKPYMSLTAGVDSRTLLACAYAKKESIRFFTWELPDSIAEQDIDVARDIADSNQLHYSVFPYASAEPEDVKAWLYRTSLTVGELRGQDLTSTVNGMDSSQPYFAGNVSEVSRGVYWRSDDEKLKTISGEEITQRLNVPLDPAIINAAEAWLADLPEGLSIRETLDLLYLEQKVGCWASEIAHGHACGPFHLYPFSNRQIFEWMLSSPDEYDYRKTKGIIKKVIEQQRPELMTWEFNGGERRQ